MTARRLSANDKARIEFTHDRLSRALDLAMFARRAGRISKKTLAIIAVLQREHERAVRGKTVAAFDAFRGKELWAEEQKRRAA